MSDDGYTHVVALSGGADSTAMALLLMEREPREYQFVCTPTGDELPEMWDHLKRLRERLGNLIPLWGETLSAGIARYKTIPSYRIRWCTRELKIERFQRWIVGRLPVVAYVGLRADEEGRPGGDYDLGMFCEMRYPLREWGMSRRDVLETLACRGIEIPKRTDCARCFFQRPREWWQLWKDHPDIYASAIADEDLTGHTFRNTNSGGPWDLSLRDMQTKFEAGDVPKTRVGDQLRGATCSVCSR